MTSNPKSVLKGYFNTGDIPTEDNFSSLIDSMERSFYPEDYGAIGDGATDDTASIQAAIDAASVSGGNVILANEYALSSAGERSFGSYPGNNYALWVNANNVHIWGPGRLLLNTKPTTAHGSFVAIAFGGDGVNTRTNVGIHGVTIDASALSAEDRLAMSAQSVGAAIGVYQCSNFYVENNIVNQGWGFCASYVFHNISEHGNIIGNKLYGSTTTGFHFDGLRYSYIAFNLIQDALQNGMHFAVNNDNNRNGIGNIVVGNKIINWYGGAGIQLTGSRKHIIQGNIIESTGVPSSGTGIILQGSGVYPTEECMIQGNSIGITGSPKGYAFHLIGVSGGECKNNQVLGNYVSGYSFGALIYTYVQDNRILNNVFDTYLSPSVRLNGADTGNSGNIIQDHFSTGVMAFATDDSTPSVLSGRLIYKTANTNPTTITMLDGGYTGQRVTILVQDSLTTMDFTGTHLFGNGGIDWSPSSGDFLECVFDGSNWYCCVHDVTA